MSTCALLDNDEVKCWGRNDVGELGDGTTTASNSPPSSGITFPSGETPVDLTNSGAGIYHYCALLDSGNVSCWGWNLYGTLGDGTTTNRLSPTLTDSLGTGRTAVQVTTGYGHTCALLDNGDIKCMGWNNQGQLGDGTTTNRNSPTTVSTSYTFNTALGSGSSGSGSGSGLSIHGTFVSLNDTTSSLSVGHHHACAVVDDKIQCWGEENGGELGDGGSSSSSSSTPVEVDITGLGTPIDVSVSEIGNTSCALFKKDLAYSFRCWGSDEVGALGDDTSYNNETSPSSNVTTLLHDDVVPTAPSSSLDVANYDIAEVSGGNAFYCARSYQGLVKCWGSNSQGRLGIGNQYFVGDNPNEMGDYQAFTDLGTELYATDITTGDNFACAVLNNTRVKCWGYGANGQLGSSSSNTYGDSANEMGDNLPYVRLPSSSSHLLSGIVKVDAGYRATCALSSDGQVYCWGYNDNYLVKSSGSLYSSYYAEHQTQLSRPAIDIAVGYYHACAILDNHQVQCWGRNSEGQLGTGNTTTPNQNVAQKERPYVDLGSDVGASDIMAGGHYTCAILTTEGTVCWGHGSQHRNGRNTTGNFITMGEELGNGTGSPYDTIAKSHRSSLSPNSPHTCIVDEMSEVQCWGSGTVVPGSGGPAPQTVNVGGLVRSVVVSDASACALRIDGNLICWGSNSNGQLGHGGTTHNYANSDGEIIIQNTDVRLWSPDTDFDGTINLWDDDDDDDGVLDINDDFSLDECASLDTDNDGMPDTIISSCSTTLVEDLDDDNDGWSDVNETNCDTNSLSSLSVPIDTDSDGICNYIDSDDDGDGWSDVQENECEANTFSSFRAFSTSDSNRYPSTSYSGELYFGGIDSSELRYLGSSASHSYTGMWRWASNTATSSTLSTSNNNLGVMTNYLTLEHQDGITYWAGNQYQGSYVDTSNAGPRNGGTNYQNIFYQSSASSYESIITVDASNRMFVADGDDRFYFQTSSQANTSTFNNMNLPSTNTYGKHHIEAQDNGTVHHLWWQSNTLKYTQSHWSANGQSRTYDSHEAIGTFNDLNARSFDLEVDSNGIAHIAYYRNSASSFAVTYMNNSGGSFSSISFEDFSPNQVGELDLDLDASDRVHLAWNDGTNGTVYHTLIDGSSSVTQQVTSHSTNPSFMSQAIDPKTNKSFILVNSGSTSTISYSGSFISESLDSTLVPGDIDSDGICDNLESAPLSYSNPVFEVGMSASITPTFPGLQPTQIINTTPLPAGLTLDSSTGVISGTPSIPNVSFSVTFNTTSTQENWTGTIEIKITPMAPLLVSSDAFDGCSPHVWQKQDIAYASDGSMYFVGNWNGNSCNAYPADIPGMENSSSFNTNALVLSKRSANGTVLWVHAIQNSGTLNAVDLAIDANDKPILLFQTFNNYATEFDRSNSHNIPAYHATTHAMILVQFDNDGQVVWKEFTKSIQSQASYAEASQNSETSLVVSPDGNITFSGIMRSSSSSNAASFGIGSGNNQINSSRNSCSNYDQPFIVRLDSTGTPLWVRIGNDNPAPRPTGCTSHFARDLAVKSDGGVILLTSVSGSVGFGNLFTKYPSYISQAIFSFDSTGQPEWYQLVYATASAIKGASIAVFDDDSVHVMATPNNDDSNHGNIVLFYDTGLTTADPNYHSGWNTTKYSHSVHSWSSTDDSRAWLLTARLNGNNGTPIWVDMNTEKIGSYDGYGSRCPAESRPSPVSYVLNNVAHTYVTDRCSSGYDLLSAYYRSSTIDNEEIHSVSSSTSNSDYEFGVIDFGPDSNDNPFILQRSDYAFYWGRYDSSSGFNYQSLSGGSQPLLYNIMGEIGHQIQDDVPQVGIYTYRTAGNHVSPYAEFGQWSLIGINGSNWLPNGLSFNANTGVITGTPSTVTANGTYWLNYTVQGRTISSQITFGVSPTAPTLSYPTIQPLERGNTMVPRTPTITGLSYLQSITITPGLPLGLTIDPSNGTISGTPVNNMTSKQYSIVACNSWGVCGAATTITLVINEPLPSPVWGGNNTLAFARDVTVRECPVTTGGGMVASWSLYTTTPSLPVGLAFNTTTGCFEGTPLLYSNAQSYIVYAQNSGGTKAEVVSINITGAGIGLTYPTGSLTLENGTAMQPIAGQTSGDNAQSWTISPSVPAGLNFGSTNGTIWGTPTASNNSAIYTVTVTSNSGFTASFSITIEILEPVEEIELTMPTGTVILVNGTPMQPLSGQTVGDAAVSWSISPELPDGLQISAT
ncbi:MAG: putative Ig domain-containing protein, partial [Candidatus Thermoplasmatota archaeon]|nr:putative Ig domain-containing protein [Candidatus Thermoplasmatota archaeon]